MNPRVLDLRLEAANVKDFVPLKFEMGEPFQFDWSEEGMVVVTDQMLMSIAGRRPR